MPRSMDAVFKALADPARRRLLDIAARRQRPDARRALRALRHVAPGRDAAPRRCSKQASLVTTVWHGREKLHYLNPVPLHEIADRWIGKFERSRLRALQRLQEADGRSRG